MTLPTVPSRPRLIATAALTAAAALTGSARAGQTGDAVTISLSGSTAMRNFTISNGLTLLNPGATITLNSGAGGAPVTYGATAGGTTSVQLAHSDTSNFTPNPAAGAPAVTTANYLALRLEWHEQGSVEGIVELADSQINDSIQGNLGYNPTAAVSTYVNRLKFGGGAPTNAVGSTVQGFQLNAFANDADRATAQVQNRVQMAISDVNAAQGFSRVGASSVTRVPGQAGYGQGNPALVGSGTGVGAGNVRRTLLPETQLNMAAGAANPAGGTYAAGPWNTAGIDNLRNEVVATTATTLAANPGTGLVRLNRSNAQWLQTTGRLANGADFNVSTRDVNSGTLNVAAVNVGVDPSFVVGENDNGVGGGTAEDSIGAGIRFSNKSSGGSNLRPTIQNSRMALGHLGLSDYRNSGGGANNGTRPLRALEYRDDADDMSNGSNGSFGYADPASGQFVRVSAQSIVDGTYVIYQNQTYVTVKNPIAAAAADSPAQWAARTDDPTTGTGIKGDNAGNDVFDVRQNVLNSVAQFPPTSTASPADALIQNAFILPQFMQVRKDRDGINQSVANPGHNPALSAAFLGSSLANNFSVTDPATVTAGTGSTYGNISAASGGVAITAGNYLFGNFNQNGSRDFSAVKAAVASQAALEASGSGNSIFSGAAAQTTKVAGLAVSLNTMTGSNGTAGATKGDLIVLGDFDSDGDFDGQDLYRLARGAALADSASTDLLTAASGADFGDRVRNGLLRKNAALDFVQANATATQKLQATANAANDPTGANAFNKFDVNRDGRVSRQDAGIVDAFVSKDYRNLNDQLGAVVATNVNAAGTRFNGDATLDTTTPRKAISLVDVELTDNGAITHVGPGSDFQILRAALGASDSGGLLDGDTDFNGDVDFGDLGTLLGNYNLIPGALKWSQGDFDFDGDVGFGDLGLLLGNYDLGALPGGTTYMVDAQALGLGAAEVALLQDSGVTVVPEPGAAAMLAFAAGLAGVRRRRRIER